MGGRIRYTEEFKLWAVSQVTDRGHSVKSVADRLGGQHKVIIRLGKALRWSARQSFWLC